MKFILTLVLKDRTTTFEYTTWSVTLFQSRFWQENPCFEQGAQPWNLTLLAKFGDNNKQVRRVEHTLNKAGAWCGGLDEKPGLRVRLLGGEDHLPVHKIVRVLYTANLWELHFVDVVQDIVYWIWFHYNPGQRAVLTSSKPVFSKILAE